MRRMRESKYTDELFKEYTGKRLDELWQEYLIASSLEILASKPSA